MGLEATEARMGQLKEFQLYVEVWMDKMGRGWQFKVWRRWGDCLKTTSPSCLKTTQRFWLDKLPPPSFEDRALSRWGIRCTLLLGQWWESFFCFLVQIKYSSSPSFWWQIYAFWAFICRWNIGCPAWWSRGGSTCSPFSYLLPFFLPQNSLPPEKVLCLIQWRRWFLLFLIFIRINFPDWHCNSTEALLRCWSFKETGLQRRWRS